MGGINLDRGTNGVERFKTVELSDTFHPFGSTGRLKKEGVKVNASENFVIAGVGRGYVLLQDFEQNLSLKEGLSALVMDKDTGKFTVQEFSEPYALEVHVRFDNSENKYNEGITCTLRAESPNGEITLIATNSNPDLDEPEFAEFALWRDPNDPEDKGRRMVILNDSPALLSKFSLTFEDDCEAEDKAEEKVA